VSSRATREYLLDMLDAARDALRIAEGYDYDAFAADSRTWRAVIQALEVVGEAAKQVDEVTRRQAPDVPWRDVASMRDRLIHGYHSVRLAVVWGTVREDLVPLCSAIERLLAARDEPREERPQ
jgi:uncharacterized protein with HEPN domain